MLYIDKIIEIKKKAFQEVEKKLVKMEVSFLEEEP